MFQLGVSSYMLKPLTREDVLRQFDYLSKPSPAEELASAAC